MSMENYSIIAEILIASFLSTFIAMPIIMKVMRRLNILGIDVHKPDRPDVPEMGGIGIILGIAVGSFIIYAWTGNSKYLAYISTVSFVGLIGLIDDLYILKAKVKTMLTIMGFLPLLIFAVQHPSQIVLGRPELPFIGRLRLTIIYWLLLPFAIAVPANAVNMMDTYNGVMSGSVAIASSSLLISSIILGRWDSAYMSAILLGAVSAFYYYNRYPARVFAGDVGSLSVGAAIGAISVLGRVEIIGVTVLMPFIMNAFHSLSSLGGLLERREIKERPVIVEGGILKANVKKGAPETLANLLLRKGEATELELINAYHLLALIAGLLGVITAILMRVKI